MDVQFQNGVTDELEDMVPDMFHNECSQQCGCCSGQVNSATVYLLLKLKFA